MYSMSSLYAICAQFFLYYMYSLPYLLLIFLFICPYIPIYSLHICNSKKDSFTARMCEPDHYTDPNLNYYSRWQLHCRGSRGFGVRRVKVRIKVKLGLELGLWVTDYELGSLG